MARTQAQPPKKETKRSLRENGRIDEEIEESFPASDPPSFAGGHHAVGAPQRPPKRKVLKTKP